ncbi:MAG: T9SS type A sorting domain-containing protein, partial [Bacteroidota bacterium]|nr:T9SS type A sorting domain-containing protein [Bacteroidota bacterium]
TATVSSSSTYGSSSMQVGEPGTKAVLIRFVCTSATIYVDNVCVSASGMGDEPSQQASLTVSAVAGTTVTIHIKKGNGKSRLLVYSKGNDVSWTPTDGTGYTGLPKVVDTNVVAVSASDVDSISVTGLQPGETYCFAVFEYNGTGESCNYLTINPGKLEQRTDEEPGITSSLSTIAFGTQKTGHATKRSFIMSARYLKPAVDNLILTGTDNFQVSDSLSGHFSKSLTVSYTGSRIDSMTIYVQFLPSAMTTYADTLKLSGGGTSTNLLLTGTGSDTDQHIYFISPNGSDSNDGSFESPWYNLQKAVDSAVAGDSIVCRGGIYYPTMMKDGTKTTVRLTGSGTAGHRICIVNYPGEYPVLNFKSQPKKQGIRGIQLNGDYCYLRGLHITEAGDNAIKVEGNHNLIERCTFSYNDDSGLQLGFGHDFSVSGFGSSNDGSHCAYNDIVDCDSYLNCDADNFGSDADGFACKMHNGLRNRFIRCRSWDNADDGFDLYETDYPVYLIECWAWGSGREANFTWVSASGSFQGNGNGIKLGGNGTGGSSKGKHEVYNCVAFNCNKTGSVKGFDQNSHGGGVKLVNCLAFGCGYDFMFEKNSYDCEYINNVCFGNIEICAGSTNSHNAMLSTTDEAWNNPVRGFSYGDYVSLSEDDAKAPRGTDGSLPTKFARLKSGSVLLDKGLNLFEPFTSEYPFLDQPIYGTARDLGPYELQEGTVLTTQMLLDKQAGFFISISNCSSSEALIHFSTGISAQAIISVYQLSGQLIQHVTTMKTEDGTTYDMPLSLDGFEKGIYLCRLKAGDQQCSCKLVVL